MAALTSSTSSTAPKKTSSKTKEAKPATASLTASKPRTELTVETSFPKEQVEKVQTILHELRTKKSSSELASLSLNKFL